MSKPVCEFCTDTVVDLQSLSVEDLLYLVADEGKGVKPEAMDHLVGMGLDAVYPILDLAIRNDSDADLRNGAMELMVRFGGCAVARLADLLNDDDEQVRTFSTVMLGDIGNRTAVVPLIGALHDLDANVRHGAAESLGRIGDGAALLPLTNLLVEDFWQQYPAVVALGEMGDSRAVPYLLPLLLDPMLAEPVMEALGKIGDVQALIPLSLLLNGSDMQFAAPAARALVAIRTSLDDTFAYKNSLDEVGRPLTWEGITDRGRANLKALLEPGRDRRSAAAAVRLLGWIGELSALDLLIPLLDAAELRDAVEGALISLGRDAIPSLCAALAHPSDNVRVSAIRALRWLGVYLESARLAPLLADGSDNLRVEILETVMGTTDEVYLPYLEGFLVQCDPVVQGRALEVLARYPFAVVGKMFERVSHADDASVRKFAPALVGLAKDGDDGELLEPFFADAAPEVRRNAVRAAGLRKSGKLVPHLLGMLADEDADVRDAVIAALAEHGPEAPCAELLRYLERGDERLDYAIIKAVGTIGCREAGQVLVAYLGECPRSRRLEFVVIETLGKLEGAEPAALKLVTEYLDHADPDIRRQAVQSLEGMADETSLVRINAACRDVHWSVRIVALQALVRIAGEVAVSEVMEALDDPDLMVRRNAIHCLGTLRNHRSVQELARLLTDPEVGKNAFDALLKFGRAGLPWLHRMMTGTLQPGLRERIIDLVGKIGNRKSIEPLMGVLDDPDPAVRLAAVDSLVFCTDSTPLKKLVHLKHHDTDEKVRNKATLALRMFTMENFG